MTEKQKRFVQEYLRDLNATQAAIRAGYSQKTAQQIGAENLSKPVIQEAIQQAQAKRAERVELTVDWVLKNLVENYLGAVEEKQRGPANRALELLGKHLGMYVEKHEHTGPRGGPIRQEVVVQDETDVRTKLSQFLEQYRATLARGAGVPGSVLPSDHNGTPLVPPGTNGSSSHVSGNGSHS